MKHDLKRVVGTNTWSTDGTEPNYFATWAYVSVSLREARMEGGIIQWEQRHSYGLLVVDLALLSQDNVIPEMFSPCN